MIAAPSAHANVYLFSFTTSQVLSALSAAASVGGSTNYNEDGFFAVWFQAPASVNAQGGDSVVVSNPDSSGVDAWTTANSFTDPSDSAFGSGSWVEFSKANNQADVSLISGNPTLFVPSNCNSGATANCHQYYDSGSNPQPVGFGSYNSLNGGSYLTNIISTGATWSFTIQTNTVLSGAYSLNGLASAINTGSSSWPLGCVGCKTSDNLSFTLSVTPTLVANPEPDTWVLLAVGVGLIAFATVWKKRTGKERSSPAVR